MLAREKRRLTLVIGITLMVASLVFMIVNVSQECSVKYVDSRCVSPGWFGPTTYSKGLDCVEKVETCDGNEALSLSGFFLIVFFAIITAVIHTEIEDDYKPYFPSGSPIHWRGQY